IAFATAQQPRRLAMPDSIPVELATALIAAGGIPGEPVILVGSLPEWFATRVTVPKTARVLGAASSGNVVVGIYSVRGAADTAVTELKTTLVSQGWKFPPPPPVYAGGRFRPAPSLPQTQQTGSSTRATLCRDDQMLTVSGAPTRGGATKVTLHMHT